MDGNPRYKMRQRGVSAIADLALQGHSLTSVTSWRRWDWYPHNDGESTRLDAGRDFHPSNTQPQFSQELRIASEGERKAAYMAGPRSEERGVGEGCVRPCGCGG